jgi:hypothetical protein
MGIERQKEGEESGSHPRDKIIFQKFFTSPRPFYLTAEHPQGEHVEKKMEKASVKKHVGESLPDEAFFNQSWCKTEDGD